jgi:hypothetical protein
VVAYRPTSGLTSFDFSVEHDICTALLVSTKQNEEGSKMLTTLKFLNIGLAFLLELVVLGALGY